MSAIKQQLMAAIEAGDHQVVHRLGWGEVWEDLATGWAPRQACTLPELGSYVRLLGDNDPDDVLAAIRECAGDFRPVPGAVLACLNRQRADSARVDVGRGHGRHRSEEAIRAAADAWRAGERECACGAPTARTWRPDPNCVLRCAECGGLLTSQLYEAEDAGHIDLAEEAA